eukprot:6039545-Prorocentrum_lima.AAC.1
MPRFLRLNLLLIVAPQMSSSLALFDSHCHAGIDPSSHHAVAAIRSRACLMATQEADWTAVLDAHAARPEALSTFGIGVHP